MNAVALLMALLVLSYFGSLLVEGRAIRGFGLPSGAEYVLLGFVLGPALLGIIPRALVDSFGPILEIALGWLAVVLGLEFGRSGDRTIAWRRILAGSLISLFTGGAIALAIYAYLSGWTTFDRIDRWVIACGIGAACADTSRHAVRWAAEKQQAHGPLLDLLGDLTNADNLVPLLASAAVFSMRPLGGIPSLPAFAWVGASIGLGVLLGLAAALLLQGEELRADDAWGMLIGISLLSIGLASRLGMSVLTVAFFQGLTLAITSRHTRKLRAMIAPTERPVMLPALLLAGVRIHWESYEILLLLAAIAVVVRFSTKIVSGEALRRGAAAARHAGRFFGATLWSTGSLTVATGLAFALRFPGQIGDIVLATAVLVTIAGELGGPARLLAEIRRRTESGPSPPAKHPEEGGATS